MKHVMVTGANGFIGSQLVRFLLSQEIEVTGVDLNHKKDSNHNRYHSIQCNLLEDSLEDMSCFRTIDTIYHTAWIGVNAKQRDNYLLQLSNLTIHLKILELAKKMDIGRTIFLGSASEYAGQQTSINSQSKFSPIESYGVMKAACHLICQTWANTYQLPINWVVISSLYGPGREDNSLISYTIKNLLKKRKPSFTNLEQKWNYIYIDDLIEALYLLGIKGTKNKEYFLGGIENESLEKYVREIHQQIDPSLPLGIGEKSYKSAILDNSIMDVGDFTADTGFVPQTSFLEGISKTITFYKGLII